MAGFKKHLLASEGYSFVKNLLTCLIVPVIILFSGCTREFSPEEYVEWVRDYENGLHVRQDVNELVFDLQYKPDDLVRLERSKNATQDSLKYFTLKIGAPNQPDLLHHGTSDPIAVQENLYYYSYLFQDNIFIEYRGVKFPCVLYHFERLADSKNMCVFNLGFEAPAFGDDDTIHLEITSEKLYSLPVRLKITHHNVPKLQI
jgi:hypothetical protein